MNNKQQTNLSSRRQQFF